MSAEIINGVFMWARPLSIADNTTYNGVSGFDPRSDPAPCVPGGLYNSTDTAKIIPDLPSVVSQFDANIDYNAMRPVGTFVRVPMYSVYVNMRNTCSSDGITRQYWHNYVSKGGSLYGEAFYSTESPEPAMLPESKRIITVSSMTIANATWKPFPGSSTTPIPISRPTALNLAINLSNFKKLFKSGDFVNIYVKLSALLWSGSGTLGSTYDIIAGEQYETSRVLSWDSIAGGGSGETSVGTSQDCIISGDYSKNCLHTGTSSKREIL